MRSTVASEKFNYQQSHRVHSSISETGYEGPRPPFDEQI
jgi:hypothetical protein